MALRGCFGCLKFLVFVVNFLFWLFGLGVMAVSLWLLFDQQLYLQSVGAESTDYFVGTYIILGVGMLMTLVGFLGCCGAWKESTWMLGTFFVFLIIILVGEVAVGLLIYFDESSYKDVITNSVQATVKDKYHNNTTATVQTFDLIQEGLECCGSNGPIDWQKSLYNNYRDMNAPEIGIPKSKGGNSRDLSGLFNVPQSCCKEPDSQECRDTIRNIDPNNLKNNIIYTEGCSKQMIDFVEAHVIYLIAVAGGVAVIQLIGMIFSICLCCALKRIEDFKA